VALAGLAIADCRHCNWCMAKTPERPCSIADDASPILEKIRDCDVLILASLVYFSRLSGTMACLIDRTRCFTFGTSGHLALKGTVVAALDESIRYAKERVQFGKPIARHQAVAWMIADMATDLAAARLLTRHAASLKDRGLPFGREAAMAKLFATEKAMHHAVKAVQVHGGCGTIKGAKVERLMRDAKIAEIYEGTSEAQRMVISAGVLR